MQYIRPHAPSYNNKKRHLSFCTFCREPSADIGGGLKGEGGRGEFGGREEEEMERGNLYIAETKEDDS
jgi:hypothetical protein